MIKYADYKISEVCSRFSSGKNITAENITEEGEYPVFGGNGLRGYTNTSNFTGQCAIIGRQGAYCGNVKYFDGTAYMTEHAIVAVASKEHNTKYLSYVLDGLKLGRLSGQAAQPGLSVKKLLRLTVKLPEKTYQEKISNVLSRYELLIENNDKRIKSLEQMMENLYKEWFVRFRFPGYKKCKFEAGLPTDEWSWYKLEEIVTMDRGVSYSSEEIECDDGVDLINLKNIQSFGGFRNDGSKKYSGKYKREQLVKTGDLVMGVTDMTQDRRTVGSVALIPIIHNISVISADLIKINSEINNVFLYSMFRFGNVSRYISQFANGANVLHLRPQVINRIKVYLPPKNLIENYSKMVQPIISEMDILNEKNANLIKQRNLLLPRLMSGKLKLK